MWFLICNLRWEYNYENIDSSFIVPDYKREDIYHNIDGYKRKSIIKTFIREIQD